MLLPEGARIAIHVDEGVLEEFEGIQVAAPPVQEPTDPLQDRGTREGIEGLEALRRAGVPVEGHQTGPESVVESFLRLVRQILEGRPAFHQGPLDLGPARQDGGGEDRGGRLRGGRRSGQAGVQPHAGIPFTGCSNLAATRVGHPKSLAYQGVRVRPLEKRSRERPPRPGLRLNATRARAGGLERKRTPPGGHPESVVCGSAPASEREAPLAAGFGRQSRRGIRSRGFSGSGVTMEPGPGPAARSRGRRTVGSPRLINHGISLV